LSEFSELGKRCLDPFKRLLEYQFRYNLPYDSIPICVDPVTCPMVKVLIPSDRYEEALNVFRKGHYDVYTELNKGKESIRNQNREGIYANEKNP
jgi:hypothetical protein